MSLSQSVLNVSDCVGLTADANAFFVFDSTVSSILVEFNSYLISSTTYRVICHDTTIAIASAATVATMRPSSDSASGSIAEVFYNVTFTLESLDAANISAAAGAILKTLNDSTNSSTFNNLLRQNALRHGIWRLQYAYATSSPVVVSRVAPVLKRTYRPSSQPVGADVATNTLSSSALGGIIGGSIAVGVLLIAGALLAFYYCRKQPSTKPARVKSIAFDFDVEYPSAQDTIDSTAMTAEARNILLKLKRRRVEENAKNTQAIFENEQLSSVVVDLDRSLYAENIDLKLFRQLAELTVEEVGKVLISLEMHDYKDQFASLGINGRVLAEIEAAEDLAVCDLKIPKPIARAFVKSIDELRLKGVSKAIL